jgi:DNA polymerase-1
MNIIREYMEKQGMPLRQQGKWATGSCPKCGGDDRFRVIDNGDSEFFTCRYCGAKGDTIQFLRDFRGMSFHEAKAMVLEAGAVAQGRTVSVIQVDRDRWYDGTINLLERANAYLRLSANAKNALLETRGIAFDTAEGYGLGYVPLPIALDREAFGLLPKLDADGRMRSLLVPPGITIPIQNDKVLQGLQIRRDKPWHDTRYFTLPGSKLLPMTFAGESTDTVIVVESYLCGMLVHQETGGRYTVAALGSAAVRPRGKVDDLIRRAHTVLVALDSDGAGAMQAWQYWMARYPNATRCPVPPSYGKDPTEAHFGGLDLLEWIETGISIAREERPRNGSHGVSVADESATVKHVSTVADAVEAIERIIDGCEGIGVAVEVESRAGFESHPQAGWLPSLSRLRRVAVYARAIGEVVVFEMGAIRKKHLLPLFSKTFVCNDGVELMRHFRGLRKGCGRIESTLLMDNAVTNARVEFSVAMKRYVGAELTDEHDVAQRAVALGPLLNALRARATGGRRRVYRRMRDAQCAIASMEMAGFAFDAEAHKGLVSGWRKSLKRARKGVPDDLDPGDDDAVRTWLVSQLPAETVKRMAHTTGGVISLADGNLEACGVPEVDIMRECRRLAGLIERHAGLSRYVDSGSGRVHTAYLIGGAVTGRTVNREPCLHNLPRDEGLRELFRAGDGYRLIIADVSQSQLRIAAALSGDKAMLEAYRNGGDLHTATASAIAGVRMDDVTAEQRHAAKAANFGLLFGQGAEGFRDHAARVYGVSMTRRQAEGVRRAFREAYPGLAEWQRHTVDSALASGRCATPGGRVRRFDPDAGNQAGRQALAFVVQGAEAEVMLDALASMHPHLQAMGAKLVHFMHDEVVVEAPSDGETLAAVNGAVSDHIANAFRRMCPEAPTTGLVETRVSDTWGKGEC